MTLRDLTEQESGIVVRGDAVIVTNWESSCPDGGLPLLAPWGTDLIAWPDEIVVVSEYDVADIRDVLPGIIAEVEGGIVEAQGMDIVYDANGDIPALWGFQVKTARLGASINTDDDGNLAPTEGKIYELADGTIVVAPDGWN